jgi:protein-disulfide isomerase
VDRSRRPRPGDDPHLWERPALGLDLERFERDRRSPEIAARVRADFESGIRAGITGTPTAFAHGARLGADVARDLYELSDR